MAQTDSAPSDQAEVVTCGSLLKVLKHRIKIAPIRYEAGNNRLSSISNSGRTYEAFTSLAQFNREYLRDHIYFADLRARRVFEIRGLPEPHRPFDSLRFVSDDTLEFDRWTSPHHGIRYRVNVRQKLLVSTLTLLDSDYVEQQGKGKSNLCEVFKHINFARPARSVRRQRRGPVRRAHGDAALR